MWRRTSIFPLTSNSAPADERTEPHDQRFSILSDKPLEAQRVYTDWRYRPQIEHSYRFEQEDGLDVEDMRMQ